MSRKPDRILFNFLDELGGYKFKDLGISVRVDREKFDKFPLFDTVKFTIKGRNPPPLVEFKISADKSVYYYHSPSDKITGAEIIYLKSKSQKPLAYGITSGNKTSYYKQSSIKEREYYRVIAITPINDLGDALIEENDNLNGTVTFRVDKKAPYNNIGHVAQKDIGSRYKEYIHQRKTRVNSRTNTLVVNNVDSINSIVEFTGDDKIKIQDYKLDGFSVYFYDFGVQNNTPLMIKVKVDSKEHFYRPATGHDETWVKVDAEKEMKGAIKNNDITAYLEKIKKWLFETVYVSLHKQKPYKILTVDHPKTAKEVSTVSEAKGKITLAVPGRDGGGTSTKTEPDAGKKGRNRRRGRASTKIKPNPKNIIQVNQIKCQTELGDYVCFQHDLKAHKDPPQPGRQEHEIGGDTSKNITVHISNVPIDIHIVLPGGIAGYMNVRSGDNKEEKTEFLFLQHIPKLNVFFYSPREEGTAEGMDRDMATTSGPNANPKQSTDNIPLMFNYSNHWFKPRSIDEYFFVWDRVKDLTVPDPINCNAEGAAKIKEHLDEVNRMLNRVKLNYKIESSSSIVGTTNKPSVTAHVVVNPGITGTGSGRGNLSITQGSKGASGQQVIGNTSTSSGQYGIPYPTYMNPSYNVNRIVVTYQIFQDDKMFISYMHKSINGFGVGTSFYRTKEISKKRKRQEAGQQTRSVFTFTDIEKKSLEEKSSFNYHKNLKSGLIHGVEEDLDGKVDVTANSVTVYFFNEDDHLNYPLLAEYDQGGSKYKYYVLKHGKDDNELASSQR